jgi:hypothetical protein
MFVMLNIETLRLKIELGARFGFETSLGLVQGNARAYAEKPLLVLKRNTASVGGMDIKAITIAGRV